MTRSSTKAETPNSDVEQVKKDFSEAIAELLKHPHGECTVTVKVTDGKIVFGKIGIERSKKYG